MVADKTPREDERTESARRGPRPAHEETLDLLRRAQGGDRRALELLSERCMPRMRRWATGRLPGAARGVLDTDDLVQDTFVKAVRNLNTFEPRHEGAFQLYLRQAILNRIRDVARQVARRPEHFQLDGNERARQPSPLDHVVGRDVMDRYEAALDGLSEADQALVVLRLEMDYGYAEIAEAVGKPSANAARMAVSRAIVRLAEEMRSSMRGGERDPGSDAS
jgi:RNA polymerase sigma-70 factor (ECF subfamily)